MEVTDKSSVSEDKKTVSESQERKSSSSDEEQEGEVEFEDLGLRGDLRYDDFDYQIEEKLAQLLSNDKIDEILEQAEKLDRGKAFDMPKELRNSTIIKDNK